MNKTDLVDKAYLRADLPEFRPGDTVKVHVRVVEAGRQRIQVFQGVVIRRQGGGLRETFTVRKISFGVGVERTFPLHSPSVAKLDVVSRGHVRRAKLYYLRELRGKKARIRERRLGEDELAAIAAAEAERAAAAMGAASSEAEEEELEADDATAERLDGDTASSRDVAVGADEALAEPDDGGSAAEALAAGGSEAGASDADEPAEAEVQG